MSSENIQILLVDDDADTRAAYDVLFSRAANKRPFWLEGCIEKACALKKRKPCSPGSTVYQGVKCLLSGKAGAVDSVLSSALTMHVSNRNQFIL